MRTLAALLAASLALTVAAAWFVPRFLDWGQYRTTVEAVASAGLGRPVRIAGPIRLSLLPQATLVAGDVTVAENGDGASATAGQLRLRVALWALLAGRIEPEDLVLRTPRMRLPWPLTTVVAGGLALPAGLHARVEDGTLAVGSLQVTAINGELRVDPASGTLSAAGVAAVMGRPWQVTGRLGRPAADGSATVEVSLDGQGAAVGTGGTLSGQLAADGSLTGRIAGRGPDLSLLLPAPPRSWQASGDITLGSGVALAEELELTIGGLPARGAVAVRLLPQLRLDAALETSRLDLDAWLAALWQAGRPAMPTGIELSADAAQLAGGTVRHLRTGFALGDDGVTLREATAELPGHAPLHLSGRLAGGHFTGELRVTAPELGQTLAWLRRLAPAMLDLLPAGAGQSAHVAGRLTADAGGMGLSGLSGDVDGAGLAGELSLRAGPRPVLAVTLRLDRPALDGWTPALPGGPAETASWLTALPARCAALNAEINVIATAPTWHGAALDRLALEAGCTAGTLELRRLAVGWPDGAFGLSGTVSAAGRITDGRLDVTLRHAEILADRLPAGWSPARPLFQGAASLGLAASGPPNALSLSAAAEMSDARLQMNGVLDPARPHWTGAVSLHHPGAPRLLTALGLGRAVDWLGDGSLSLQATVDAGPDQVSLSAAELSAGALRTRAELGLTALASGHPTLAGKLDVETLPLPMLDPRSADPWELGVLQRTDAKVALRVARLLWGEAAVAQDAAATVVLSQGTLRLDGASARVAGGLLAGQAVLDAAAPPRLHVSARLDGAVLDGPVTSGPVDVVSGRLDAQLDLSAAGYSPAGMLATLAGTAAGVVQDGALSGLDAARALAAVDATAADPAGAAASAGAALRGGSTPFQRLELAGRVANGSFTFDRGEAALPGGALTASGTVDLAAGALDVALALHPAAQGTPVLGLRLIGPAGEPSRTPELAGLRRWMVQR